MRFYILLAFLISFSGSFTFATTRVAEVEDHIRLNAREYMLSSYPGTKFNVEVKVIPRRQSKSVQEGDILPFFNSDSVKTKDFWEDQEKSVYQLMGKIRKVQLRFIFLDNIDISNESVFKERVLRSIGLVPGRDNVELSYEPRAILNKSLSTIVFSEKNIGFIIIATALVVICLIAFSLFNKFLKIKIDTQNSGESVSTPNDVVSSRPTQTVQSTTKSKSSSIDNVTFSDPTSSLEIIKTKVDEIVDSGTFPNLSDMIIFDKLITENQRSFSFIIFEFSQSEQDKVFRKGKNELWYKAFSKAGELDRDLFFHLDTMLRNREYYGSKEYEELLIQCWRMGDHLSGFLKSIDREDSLVILSSLPKYIAVPIARKVFPGGWGAILAEEKASDLLSDEKISEYLSEARGIYPELSKESLALYRNRKDLLSYLKNCEVFEEEEVYQVLGENSAFFNVRPPFYKFFNLEEDEKRVQFDSHSLEEWAIMIFNIGREYRKSLYSILSEKEKYLLGVHLQALDSNPPSSNVRGDLRESVGRAIFELSIDDDKVRSINEEAAA